MTKRNSPNAPETCPAPLAFAMIGGKWKLWILQILIFEGTHRFGELKRQMPGITQTMLTNQLRALEADNLVARKIYAEVPPRVEYSATKDALALVPMFTAMHEWWKARESGRRPRRGVAPESVRSPTPGNRAELYPGPRNDRIRGVR